MECSDIVLKWMNAAAARDMNDLRKTLFYLRDFIDGLIAKDSENKFIIYQIPLIKKALSEMRQTPDVLKVKKAFEDKLDEYNWSDKWATFLD